jgi:hypothetical protein
MPDMANLAGAMIFVMGNAMRVADGLRAKREHRQNQRYDQQTYGYPFSHVGFSRDHRTLMPVQTANGSSPAVVSADDLIHGLPEAEVRLMSAWAKIERAS